MAIIHGLDLGSGSAKLVRVSGGSWSARLAGSRTARVQRSDPESVLQELLGELKPGQPVRLGLDGSQAYHRWLELPKLAGLNRAKKVQAARFALEDEVPIGLEELVVDVARWRTVTGDREAALTFGLKRAELDRAAELLAEAGVTPQTVSLDTVGLLNAVRAAKIKDGLVADLGHSKTTVICLAQGEPVLLTYLGLAGRDFDEHLARARQLSPVQARAVKESTTGAEETESSFGPLLDELAGELDRIVRTMGPDPAQEGGELFLCGGLARLPGLSRGLGQRLNRRASLLSPLKGGVDPELVPAVGLALESEDFNLGRSLLKPPAVGRQALLLVGALAVVLALVGANLYLGLEKKRQTLAGLVKAEHRILAEYLPGVKRIVAPVRQMKTGLERARAQAKAAPQAARKTVLDSLLGLEKAARPALIELSEVVIDGARLTVTGTAKDFRRLEVFQSNLAKMAGFEQVLRQTARMEKGRAVFRLRMKR